MKLDTVKFNITLRLTDQNKETAGRGEYSSIANFRTKILKIFRGIFGDFRCMIFQKCIYVFIHVLIYFMIYRGPCLRNRGLLSSTGKHPMTRLIWLLCKVKERLTSVCFVIVLYVYFSLDFSQLYSGDFYQQSRHIR